MVTIDFFFEMYGKLFGALAGDDLTGAAQVMDIIGGEEYTPYDLLEEYNPVENPRPEEPIITKQKSLGGDDRFLFSNVSRIYQNNFQDISRDISEIMVGSTKRAFDLGVSIRKLMTRNAIPASCYFVKDAMISGNNAEGCPFGLSIAKDCERAGPIVDYLIPILENDSKELAQRKMAMNAINFKKMLHKIKEANGAPTKCKYARHIMKKEVESVICDWGEASAGVDPLSFTSGVGAAYPTSMWAGIMSLPSAIPTSDYDSWFAKSPGTGGPFGYSTFSGGVSGV